MKPFIAFFFWMLITTEACFANKILIVAVGGGDDRKRAAVQDLNEKLVSFYKDKKLDLDAARQFVVILFTGEPEKGRGPNATLQGLYKEFGVPDGLGIIPQHPPNFIEDVTAFLFAPWSGGAMPQGITWVSQDTPDDARVIDSMASLLKAQQIDIWDSCYHLARTQLCYNRLHYYTVPVSWQCVNTPVTSSQRWNEFFALARTFFTVWR